MTNFLLMRRVAVGLVCLAAIAGCSFEGHARDGVDADDSSDAGQFSSCDNLAATCGPDANDNCCAIATPIPGGTFYRSHDVAADGMYSDMIYPATVSSFVLDKYEVTVGRFRKFVSAGMGTQVHAPAPGIGARRLNGMDSQGGWDASWNGQLSSDTAALKAAVKCDPLRQTWTDTAGTYDNRPMNCITWYEAAAFCAWDGGHLPTDVELNYASAGGSEQRTYAWSSPSASTTIDCSHANYDVDIPSGTSCNGATGSTNRVGSGTSSGDGRWGQSDLAGNVWEWTLDWYDASHPLGQPGACDDCANLTSGGTGGTRSVHGGSFGRHATELRAASHGFSVPTERTSEFGLRCSRS